MMPQSKFIRLQVASLGILLLLSHACLADESAQELFERMSNAVERLSYRGTFVHSNNNQLETMEVLHKVQDGLIYERMSSRSGPPREFIRVGEEIQCIVESRKEVMVDLWQNQNPLTSTLPKYSERLAQNYRFERIQQSYPVAGRPTVAIAIVPKDNFRYGYRLLLDKITAMPLVCDSIDQNGKLIESLHFTSIEYDPQFEENAFKATLDVKDFRWINSNNQRQTQELKDGKWRADEVPNGFSLSVSQVELAGDSRIEHYIYSDGLATVSVFAEPRAPGQATMHGEKTIGVTNAFGRVEGDVQITVLGEVPVETVKVIGNSFRPH